ncbi:YraN family protein [Reinekea sp.]|jgi:putative endonuclease|uniref:YraN family protein n=1 Tax=Reinekea sp. TaxID=1970455 RepID=UPI003989F2C2
MQASHLATGEASEQIAENHLIAHGLITVAKNVRFKAGELDLVCLDGKELVFVEVRFRKNDTFGSAVESVTRPKQRKVIKAAALFLQQNREWEKHIMRFDVVGIDSNHKVDWIKGAFLATV